MVGERRKEGTSLSENGCRPNWLSMLASRTLYIAFIHPILRPTDIRLKSACFISHIL